MSMLMHEKLKDLFFELSLILSQRPQDEQRFLQLDSSSLVILKILHVLLDDDALIKRIAGSLSMVFNPGCGLKRQDLKQELFEAFVLIDRNVDDDQRGFAALFDRALEQISIKHDPQVMLASIAYEQPLLADHFSNLTQAFLVYRELEAQISSMPSQVAPCLFVMGLKDLFASHQNDSELLIADWLLCRVANKILCQLYNMVQRPVIRWTKVPQEHVLVMVCLLVARLGWGKLCDMDDMRQALQQLGIGDMSPVSMLKQQASVK